MQSMQATGESKDADAINNTDKPVTQSSFSWFVPNIPWVGEAQTLVDRGEMTVIPRLIDAL